MPEFTDHDLATLVRDRLEARRPVGLPPHFVPRPARQHRARWTFAASVAALLLGFAVAALIRPYAATAVLSGLLGRSPAIAPAVTHSTPAPPVASAPARRQTGGGGAPAPSATPAPEPSQAGGDGGPASGGAGGVAPTPVPSDGAPIQVTLPPLPIPSTSICVPTLLPSLPPLPLPTPPGGCIQLP